MVKCADCGLLALRNRITGQLDEAEESFRETGEMPQRRRPGVTMAQHAYEFFEYPYRSLPICFARAARLDKEVAGVTEEFEQRIPEQTAREHLERYENVAQPKEVATVVSRDRQCDEFTEWHQGFSPKEHREMLDRKLIVDREDERDKESRGWQAAENRSNRRWRFAEFVVAVLAVAVVLIVAFAA